MQAEHQIDVTKLSEYLRSHIPAFRGAIELMQFQGGQSNPTFGVTSESHRLVLRRKPVGALLQSAHAVEREYRIITNLRNSVVPVPKTWCLCEDPSVLGTAFYVMDWVDGRILWDPTLPGLGSTERAAMFDEMNRVIAALHNISPDSVGLEDYGRPGNYIARQLDRWIKQYRVSTAEPTDAIEKLIEWLPQNIPETTGVSLVHGDYRLDNLIFHPTAARVLAVLDWELSTLGDPLADFAYHSMIWQIPKRLFRGLKGVDINALGIPPQSDYVYTYCRRTGRTGINPDDWRFYTAYNLFRLSAIMQGIAGRANEGTAISEQALTIAANANAIAELGLQEIQYRRAVG
jgi:aminoglycoside phosphotransferase (APT) family kinase protein